MSETWEPSVPSSALPQIAHVTLGQLLSLSGASVPQLCNKRWRVRWGERGAVNRSFDCSFPSFLTAVGLGAALNLMSSLLEEALCFRVGCGSDLPLA